MFKKRKKKYGLFFLFTLIFFTSIFAQHQQKAHVHGTSNLTIAFENNIIQIQLDTPLIDIVGFEGKPNTKTQKEAIKHSSEILKNWKGIFTLKGGSCKEKSINISTEQNTEEHRHKHEKHHSHKHKSQHKENKDIHSEIKVFYEFDCINTNKFSSIKILLFEKFPRIQKVNAQWATVNEQGQRLLDKKQNLLVFR